MRELPVIGAVIGAVIVGLITVSLRAGQETQRAAGLFVRTSVAVPAEVAEWRLVDLDGKDGAVFVAQVSGRIETVRFDRDPAVAPRRGAGRLADPRHCCLMLAPIAGTGVPDLLVASPRGVERFVADAEGVFSEPARVLVARAKVKLRTGRPTFAPLAQDVDGDGRADLVVPNGEALDVWIQQPPSGAAQDPSFAKAATVKVRVASSAATGSALLSDDLQASVTIPGLRLADVNGDGRPDLLVEDGEKRAFHLVRADGSIPREPDVTVDLGIFRDTTPQASLTPGRTLAGSDRAVYESRDLDQDGVPDYVIAHRRKVWVFHGTKHGPQFTEPTTILKAADDVTALLVVDLDGDQRPDLLLIKVQVPSVAAILRGLVAEWTVDVDAIGYRNGGQRTFETSPRWRNTLSFKVPSILSVMKDPDKIVQRFEGVGKKFRMQCEGDLDGDGVVDVGLVSEDGTTLEVWRGTEQLAQGALESNDIVMRRILFEDENRTWDLERLLEWIGGFGDRRIKVLTGGRESSARLALRAKAAWRLIALAPADVDGDGRAEVVLRYDAVAPDVGSVFDVVAWR